MRLPTVRLYHPRKKKFKVVNLDDYAADLGVSRFAGWQRVGEKHNESPVAEKLEVKTPPPPPPKPEPEPVAEESTPEESKVDNTEDYAPISVDDEPPPTPRPGRQRIRKR